MLEELGGHARRIVRVEVEAGVRAGVRAGVHVVAELLDVQGDAADVHGQVHDLAGLVREAEVLLFFWGGRTGWR